MDFYVLLIIPHILAIAGLIGFAFRITEDGPSPEEGFDQTEGGDGGSPVPTRPSRPQGGLPLPEAIPPPRRLRAGEQLADLHPRPARRERESEPPHRAPIRA
jgi:hypothetical protein